MNTFELMPDHARIWVYQANRNLTESEQTAIEQYLVSNVAQWAAHGTALSAAVRLVYGRFVVIALDEQQHAASGCSIDASTHWFKTIEVQTGISFFDRSVAYFDADGAIQTIGNLQIKQAIAEGQLNADTIIFDNLVSTLGQLRGQWQKPAAQTWLKRYFSTQIAS
jgi:hypothetical protein